MSVVNGHKKGMKHTGEGIVHLQDDLRQIVKSFVKVPFSLVKTLVKVPFSLFDPSDKLPELCFDLLHVTFGHSHPIVYGIDRELG